MAKTITINLGDLYDRALRKSRKVPGGFSAYVRKLIEADLESGEK